MQQAAVVIVLGGRQQPVGQITHVRLLLVGQFAFEALNPFEMAIILAADFDLEPVQVAHEWRTIIDLKMTEK
ncbi:MAG: hypothetical protein Tsb0017_16530 [Geothermobacteraceae bacterium]